MKHFSIFQKHKYRGNLNWYGRIAENGRFRVVSLGTTKKSDAEMWLSKMNYEKFLPQPPEHSDATIIEACNKFLDKISIGNNISHRTLEAYTQELAHFKEWCNLHKFKYVSQINELDAIDFSASIISRFAPKTSREIIRCSKSMMDFACRAYKVGTTTHISNTVSLRVLRKAVKSAGLNQADANNHKFRHSFASNLVRAGVNLKTVHELMRHRGNIEITMEVYSHLLPSDLKNAIDTIQ